MTKPAPKEPSMDEILSSIRQIIADDDAAAAPRGQPGAALRTVSQPEDADDEVASDFSDDEALALSADQILSDEDQPRSEHLSFEALIEGGNELDADDSAEDEGAAFPASSFAAAEEGDEAETTSNLESDASEDPQGTEANQNYSSHPRPSVAQAAPMPDPKLSRDITNQLIEPVTNAAVRHTFSKLSETAIGAQSVTIEGMLRDTLRETLRPMLQEWLDENLPMIVEALVEKEIARISRGVE